MVSSLFLGCIDTDSVGLGSIGGTTDPIAKSEKSGIFSEDVPGADTGSNPNIGMNIENYEVVYNNGNEMYIKYENMLHANGVEQVIWIRFDTKRPNEERYRVSFENGKPTEYYYALTKGDEYYSETIYWDAAGRVDPRSDGDIDRANKFIEAGLKKGKQVKERFYAKELGDWN